MKFIQRLKQLPCANHIAELQLIDANGKVTATIANCPGTAGSVRVYHALSTRNHGLITTAEAKHGLELFAEHTIAARQQPGSHPNIDRLFHIIATGQVLRVQALAHA